LRPDDALERHADLDGRMQWFGAYNVAPRTYADPGWARNRHAVDLLMNPSVPQPKMRNRNMIAAQGCRPLFAGVRGQTIQLHRYARDEV
jgi:hypothetical protein